MEKITSNQRRQYNRFTTDGARKALTVVAPGKEGLQRLFARGGEWQAYLEAGIRKFTAETPAYELAKNILGRDFISPEEIAAARGLAYTDEQLATFGNTLPTQEVLEWCRNNGMMLVAGPPKSMSLLDVRAVKVGYFYSKEGGWYAESKQKFARIDKVETVWIALRKEPVVGSPNRNWAEQSALVSGPMSVPNAAEAAWGLTTYKAARDEYLLSGLYVRTSSFDSDGYHVGVGGFGVGGLGVSNYWDLNRRASLGLAGSRKF